MLKKTGLLLFIFSSYIFCNNLIAETTIYEDTKPGGPATITGRIQTDGPSSKYNDNQWYIGPGQQVYSTYSRSGDPANALRCRVKINAIEQDGNATILVNSGNSVNVVMNFYYQFPLPFTPEDHIGGSPTINIYRDSLPPLINLGPFAATASTAGCYYTANKRYMINSEYIILISDPKFNTTIPGSGVKSISWVATRAGAQAIVGNSVTIQTADFPTGDYNFTITATDNVGNSTSKSSTFSIDHTMPNPVSVIGLAGDGYTPAGVSSLSNPSYIKSIDELNKYKNGISSSLITLNKSAATDVGGAGINDTSYQYNITGPLGPLIDQYYQLTVTVADNAGNRSNNGTPLYLKVDNQNPVPLGSTAQFTLESYQLSYSQASRERYDQLVAVQLTNCVDTQSGIQNYSITLNGQTVPYTSASSNFASAIIFVPDTEAVTNRGANGNLQLELSVTDKVNNRTTISYNLTLPKHAAITEITSQLDGTSAEAAVKNAITINLTKNDLVNYRNLKLVRISGGSALLDDSLTTHEIIINTENPDTLSYVNGFLTFYDEISADTAAGNKFISYKVYQSLQNTTAETRAEYASISNNVRMANHPGQLNYVLRDLAGHIMRFDSEGKAIQTADSAAFKIGLDGKLFVGYESQDSDNDTWDSQLQRYASFQGDQTSEYQNIESYTAIAVSRQLPSGTGQQSDVQLIGIDTSAGASNTITYRWTEGNAIDGFRDSQRAGILNIKREADGSVTAYVIQDADTSSTISRLIVRPGETFTLSVNGTSIDPDTIFKWHFDDTHIGEGQTISHTYEQDNTNQQLTAVRNYTIQLYVSTSSEPVARLPVNVIDTQAGRLLVDEIWRGDHLVNGVIIVPSGRTLTIGAHYLPAAMAVQFTGNNFQGYEQGIVVEAGGTLLVNSASNRSVTFQNASDNLTGWGTIMIESGASAVLNGSKIQDAQRGLTVIETATVTLDNVTFKANHIGVHAVGATNLDILNCLFERNSIYGIKEEQGAECTLRNNSFKENFRNYYDWSQGPIDFTTLNSGTNTGNRETE